MKQRGFTLIETLVALAIAATALIVLMGRLGASADLQRKLMAQVVAVDEARNLLAQEIIQPSSSGRERKGKRKLAGHQITWRLWSESTVSKQLVRQNVQVNVDHDGQFELFVYRHIK